MNVHFHKLHISCHMHFETWTQQCLIQCDVSGLWGEGGWMLPYLGKAHIYGNMYAAHIF